MSELIRSVQRRPKSTLTLASFDHRLCAAGMKFTSRDLNAALAASDEHSSRFVWDAVVRTVEQSFNGGRGLNVPGLGRWTFLKTSNVRAVDVIAFC